MITLAIILGALLVIACLQLLFHVRLNEEDGRRLAKQDAEIRDLTGRNVALTTKANLDELLILTLAQELASRGDVAEVRQFANGRINPALAKANYGRGAM